MSKQCKTSIGGQALIEGIMMRGPFKTAMAVRLPSGGIDIEEWETQRPNAFYKKIPLVRGIFNFIDMLILGYKCLMKSAEKQGIEEEPTKFEKYLEKKFGDSITKVFEAIVVVFGFGLAILLFTMFPAMIVGHFKNRVTSHMALTAIEGVLKIVILVLYLWLVSKMDDIKRTFQYHGAEHKTIFCFEHGMELNVQNVRKELRFHPRCGTSFLLIVLIISIILFSFITWESIWIRIGLKILFLPLVVGIGYEFIKVVGKYDNFVTRNISKPGLWLQRLTTKEPDDDQIEVAIAAFKPVVPEDIDNAKW